MTALPSALRRDCGRRRLPSPRTEPRTFRGQNSKEWSRPQLRGREGAEEARAHADQIADPEVKRMIWKSPSALTRRQIENQSESEDLRHAISEI
jgi:hypothetical protein